MGGGNGRGRYCKRDLGMGGRRKDVVGGATVRSFVTNFKGGNVVAGQRRRGGGVRVGWTHLFKLRDGRTGWRERGGGLQGQGETWHYWRKKGEPFGDVAVWESKRQKSKLGGGWKTDGG